MRVAAATLRNFRSHEKFAFEPSSGLTVLAGPNGSGKTNILEAIHFGLTGRSCRTSSDRQVISHGEQVARVEIELAGDSGRSLLAVALDRGCDRRTTLDGNRVEGSVPATSRPMSIVFLPDRLNLITGPPGPRRAHVDQLAAALRPSVAAARSDYTRILVQRNALISAARSSGSLGSSIDAWDRELARAGSLLVRSRQSAIEAVASEASAVAEELGLAGELGISHRSAAVPDEGEYFERLSGSRREDLERGYTHFGPHRGDLVITKDGFDIKANSSQGEKRIALLSLLLAERQAITGAGHGSPLLLLDDVMSELDAERRALLVERVSLEGQCIITATEFDHVPSAGAPEVLLYPIGGKGLGLRAA